MHWYLEVFRKYAVFSGRARRKEYWFFFLFNLIVSIVLTVCDLVIGTFDAQGGIGVLSGLYSLAVIVPSLAVSVRRLHDTNRSGWWLLIALVPLAGAIALLVFLCLDSDPGTNRFGPNPKEEEAPGAGALPVVCVTCGAQLPATPGPCPRCGARTA